MSVGLVGAGNLRRDISLSGGSTVDSIEAASAIFSLKMRCYGASAATAHTTMFAMMPASMMLSLTRGSM